jgi:hypothetical protein
MSDFADVEHFAREHATCGGLTPNAMSRPGRSGYQLTITCACGASFDRWVTAEQASRPLPRPTSAPPRVTTWPARPAPPPAARIEVAVPPGRRVSHGRAVWAVLLLVVALTAAAVYVTDGTATLTSLGSDALTSLGAPPPHVAAPGASSPGVAAPSPAPPAAPPAPRPPLAEIAHALRELQTGITPSVSLNDYAARVAATRVDVERLLASASEPARAQVHEVLDVHRLAVAAWRARIVDDRDEWARVGRDPAVELCPSVKRAADAAGPSAAAARARARGAAVAASLTPLWECAAEKLAALDRPPAGG